MPCRLAPFLVGFDEAEGKSEERTHQHEPPNQEKPQAEGMGLAEISEEGGKHSDSDQEGHGDGYRGDQTSPMGSGNPEQSVSSIELPRQNQFDKIAFQILDEIKGVKAFHQGAIPQTAAWRMRRTGMKAGHDLDIMKKSLRELRDKGKVLVAVLFGSQANGGVHVRSDIDLGLYFAEMAPEEELEATDKILMCSDLPVSILRLDDADESPLVVQEALKGVHLVEPDKDTLYRLYHRVLHETESIRSRREARLG